VNDDLCQKFIFLGKETYRLVLVLQPKCVPQGKQNEIQQVGEIRALIIIRDDRLDGIWRLFVLFLDFLSQYLEGKIQKTLKELIDLLSVATDKSLLQLWIQSKTEFFQINFIEVPVDIAVLLGQTVFVGGQLVGLMADDDEQLSNQLADFLSVLEGARDVLVELETVAPQFLDEGHL
jgi:hypothetical protein